MTTKLGAAKVTFLEFQGLQQLGQLIHTKSPSSFRHRLVLTHAIKQKRSADDVSETEDNLDQLRVVAPTKVRKLYEVPSERYIQYTAKKLLLDSSEYPADDEDDVVFDEDDEEVYLLVSKTKYDLPTYFEQMITSPEKDQWIAAHKEELDAIQNNNVHYIVKKNTLPPSTTVIKGRYVCTVKDEGAIGERFKVRLVAKGFTQEAGVNLVSTYSPVMAFDSMRLLFTLSSINGWQMPQLDAKNAFLNGDIDYPVYFAPPPGTNTPQDCVWKLNKGLYGLKQAPYLLYQTPS